MAAAMLLMNLKNKYNETIANNFGWEKTHPPVAAFINAKG